LNPGGAERQWCYLAQALKAMGYDVSFFVTSRLTGDAAHYLPLLTRAGIQPIELKAVPIQDVLANLPDGTLEQHLLRIDHNTLATTLNFLTAMFSRLHPKAVIAQLDIVNVLAGTAGILARVPNVLLSFRNYSPVRFPYLSDPLFLPSYSALASAERIILTGNSRAGNDDYAAWLGIQRNRIHWVPNAVDSESAAQLDPGEVERVKQELAWTANDQTIIGVFRLSEEKQPRMFIDVCAAVLKSKLGGRALIVGVGPMMTALKAYVRDLGLESKIIFLGRRSDVDVLLHLSNVLLLTSAFEGMPNVVMEALSMGVPVVASKVGGVPDCVADGQDGYLVSPDDFEGFVARCSALLSNRTLATQMGRCGAETMKIRFSKRAMAQHFLSIISGEAIRDAGQAAFNESAFSR
jgi:glycosyltransferase involved in cell wall biosynthesis